MFEDIKVGDVVYISDDCVSLDIVSHISSKLVSSKLVTLKRHGLVGIDEIRKYTPTHLGDVGVGDILELHDESREISVTVTGVFETFLECDHPDGTPATFDRFDGRNFRDPMSRVIKPKPTTDFHNNLEFRSLVMYKGDVHFIRSFNGVFAEISDLETLDATSVKVRMGDLSEIPVRLKNIFSENLKYLNTLQKGDWVLFEGYCTTVSDIDGSWIELSDERFRLNMSYTATRIKKIDRKKVAQIALDNPKWVDFKPGDIFTCYDGTYEVTSTSLNGIRACRYIRNIYGGVETLVDLTHVEFCRYSGGRDGAEIEWGKEVSDADKLYHYMCKGLLRVNSMGLPQLQQLNEMFPEADSK